MDNLGDFYLVLPSNNSLVYFPDNSTTCFTTRLSREIRLSGEWSVGLAEIHVPCTIMHIQEHEGFYEFQLGSKDGKNYNPNDDFCSFPYGIYDSIEQLAEEINKTKGVSDHQILKPTEFQKGFYTLVRKCSCDWVHRTFFNEKIRRVFGFEDDVHRQTGTFATSNSNIVAAVGSRPASLSRAIPDQLYVYSDICEPYTVGDTQAALLRIVSLDTSKYKFGSNTVRHFAPIHYIPLLQRSFQSVVIDIRDKHGQRVPFEYGTLTVTLHFKRNR